MERLAEASCRTLSQDRCKDVKHRAETTQYALSCMQHMTPTDRPTTGHAAPARIVTLQAQSVVEVGYRSAQEHRTYDRRELGYPGERTAISIGVHPASVAGQYIELRLPHAYPVEDTLM